MRQHLKNTLQRLKQTSTNKGQKKAVAKIIAIQAKQ